MIGVRSPHPEKKYPKHILSTPASDNVVFAQSDYDYNTEAGPEASEASSTTLSAGNEEPPSTASAAEAIVAPKSTPIKTLVTNPPTTAASAADTIVVPKFTPINSSTLATSSPITAGENATTTASAARPSHPSAFAAQGGPPMSYAMQRYLQQEPKDEAAVTYWRLT